MLEENFHTSYKTPDVLMGMKDLIVEQKDEVGEGEKIEEKRRGE